MQFNSKCICTCESTGPDMNCVLVICLSTTAIVFSTVHSQLCPKGVYVHSESLYPYISWQGDVSQKILFLCKNTKSTVSCYWTLPNGRIV